MPKVPIISEKEETAIAKVNQKPDLSTNYKAKLIRKYMKKRKIHKYINTKVARLIDLYRNRSK